MAFLTDPLRHLCKFGEQTCSVSFSKLLVGEANDENGSLGKLVSSRNLYVENLIPHVRVFGVGS